MTELKGARRYSLKIVTVIFVMTSILVFTLIGSGVFFYSDYQNAEERLRADVQVKANYLGAMLAPSVVFNDKNSATIAMSIAASDSQITGVLVTDMSGQEFATYGSNLYLETSRPTELVEAEPVIRVTSELLNRGEQVGLITLTHIDRRFRALISQYIKILISALICGMSVAFVLMWFIQHFITRTIDNLAEITHSISFGREYKQRIPEQRFKEFHKLSNTLNIMLKALDTHDKNLKEHNEELESLVALRTEQLNQRANFDALTNLPNRYLLKDRLEEMINLASEEQSQLAVFLIDLNRFKQINDSLGHFVGDQLLSLTAKRLSSLLGQSCFLARLGGDEFVAVVPRLVEDRAVTEIADSIIEGMKKSFVVGDHSLFVSASIGISLFPEHATNGDSLLRCADISMYSIKESRGNSYQIFQDSLESYRMRLKIEQNLRIAVTEQSLRVEYQPKFDIETEQMVGLEALARWSDSELGDIPPFKFIPIAEEIGLIHDLTFVVLAQACVDLKRWKRLGLRTCPIAINISPSSLLLPHFVERFSSEIEQAQLNFSDFEIEITEEVFMQESTDIIRLFNQLRSKGMSIALDDFGTGYSSMLYLSSCPLDHLKIDGSFIRAIENSSKNRSIVKSLIALAHGLGLSVTAECVEREGQLSFLKENNCNLMQGFLRYPSLPPRECEALLEQDSTIIRV